MVVLWLIRHGETVENIEKRITGQNEGKLTKLGENQAKCIGKALSKKIFDFAYVSDLNRTKETFENIHMFMEKKIPLDSISFEKIIREKTAGVLDGKKYQVFHEMANKEKKSAKDFRPENGENYYDFIERVKKFFDILIRKHVFGKNNLCCNESNYIFDYKDLEKFEQMKNEIM